MNENIFDDRNKSQGTDNELMKTEPTAPEAPSMPLLQLTPEQISALLNQLIIVQNPQQAPDPSPSQLPSSPKGPNDPGKRILYQSADFDEAEKITTNMEASLTETIEQSDKRSLVIDDDDLFGADSMEQIGLKSVFSSPSSVKTTDFGSDFSVSEVELPDEYLPSVKKKEAASITPADYEKKEEKKEEKEDIIFEEETLPVIRKETKKVRTSMQIEDYAEEAFEPENKKLSVTEIIRRTVLGVSLLAIVISAAVLLREYKMHKDNSKLEEDISNLIISEAETTKKPPKVNKEDKTEKHENETTALTPEQQWAEIKAENPNVLFPPGMQLKYAKLFATNPDFVGYLSADGIDMSLPIVQTQNDEKYMTKNFYGKSTKYGCPFVTHLNSIFPNHLDMNTVIFGHHMNDGTVFGILDRYKSIEGFKKAPVITFNTLYNDYEWKVIAAFVTNAYEKDDNGYIFQYYFTSLSTTERFSAFLNELAQRSLYDTGVDVLPTDKILTLSTCSHEFTDARFVVVARLVRPGESAEVDVENAVVNSSPRYPQAYYDKQKKDNPYKNAQKWYIG